MAISHKRTPSRPLVPGVMRQGDETFRKLQEMRDLSADAADALYRARAVLTQLLSGGQLRILIDHLAAAKTHADAISGMTIPRPLGHQDYASHVGDLVYALAAKIEGDLADDLLHIQDVNRALAEAIQATMHTEHLVVFGRPIPDDRAVVPPDEQPTSETSAIPTTDTPVQTMHVTPGDPSASMAAALLGLRASTEEE
ncbi:MAG: hypothetical protein KGH75_00550 [Rhodospirillales bacterium]|nr:hypothetical protein [Rhodospirillales bacterium]